MGGLFLTAVLPLAAFALLTVGNAFFVAAEFGLVTVDRSEIDKRADEGDKRARTVRHALRELSFQLSGTQLGITITALLTGSLAEPALSKLLTPHQSLLLVHTLPIPPVIKFRPPGIEQRMDQALGSSQQGKP